MKSQISHKIYLSKESKDYQVIITCSRIRNTFFNVKLKKIRIHQIMTQSTETLLAPPIPNPNKCPRYRLSSIWSSKYDCLILKKTSAVKRESLPA